MKPALILYDRVFENFRCYDQHGHYFSQLTFVLAQLFLKETGYTEVPINSKIGRQILAKIGEQKE